MKRKSFAARLLVCIFVSCMLLQTVAYAAPADIPTYNKNVSDYARQLEEKYNIIISYPTFTSGYAAIGTVTLGMLDQSLEYLTPNLVRQLSDFFHKVKGSKILIEYTFPPNGFETRQGIQLASFTSEYAKLQIYIPRYNGQMLISGSSPSAIIHEFGHAFHDYIEYKHGKSNIYNQWIGYNDGYSYQLERLTNPSETAFASPYASTEYHEDFAEAFSLAFTANRSGLGVRNRLVNADNSRTNLGKKVGMIEALIPMYATNTETALQTLRLIYNTSANTTYLGVTMSGNALEYIGFSEPNGVKDGVLKALGLQATSSEWHKDIGGWKIIAASGDSYLIFPGGNSVKLSASQKAA